MKKMKKKMKKKKKKKKIILHRTWEYYNFVCNASKQGNVSPLVLYLPDVMNKSIHDTEYQWLVQLFSNHRIFLRIPIIIYHFTI